MAARAPSFRLEQPAPARTTGAPSAPPAAPELARPVHVGRLLGLPLTDLHLRRIEELEALVGDRYLGWGREGVPAGRDCNGEWLDATWDEFFVDVLRPGYRIEDLRADGEGSAVLRFTDETLHAALGVALRALRGDP